MILHKKFGIAFPAKHFKIKSEMLQPRADHCMESYRGKLYVVGG